MIEEVDRPLALDLRADRAVAERGRALRPIQHEQVREARDRHAEVGVDSARPRLGEGAAGCPAEIDRGQAAGVGVESGGEHEHVEIDVGGRGAHTCRRHRLDRCRPDVDDVDRRQVEQIEVVLLERRPLRPERVRRLHRGEDVGDGGVVDAGAGLVAPELVGEEVGVFVDGDVVEGRRPEVEAAELPGPLEHLRPELGRRVEGAHLDALEILEAAGWRVASSEALGIVDLGGDLLVAVEALLLHRDRQHRRSLKHGQVAGDRGDLLDHLHAAGAGADDADALAGDVDAGLGPHRRVVAPTSERVEPR